MVVSSISKTAVKARDGRRNPRPAGETAAASAGAAEWPAQNKTAAEGRDMTGDERSHDCNLHPASAGFFLTEAIMGVTRERMLMKRLQAGADLFAFQLNGAAPPPVSGHQRRKALIQPATPADFGEFDRFVLSEAEEACKRRAAMTGYAWQVDHMIPLARGGAHAWHNIQVLPQRLNSWKCDRLVLTQPGEWVSMLPGALGALF